MKNPDYASSVNTAVNMLIYLYYRVQAMLNFIRMLEVWSYISEVLCPG
jgi:hypothetical protein